VADEAHTIVTEGYGQLLVNAKKKNVKVIGLTATLDDRKSEKRLFYSAYCPIVYEFYDSAVKGFVNKRKYIIFEYTLSDLFKVEVGSKNKKWLAGEATQYNYIQSQLKEAEDEIREILEVEPIDYTNYYAYADSWYRKKTGDTAQQKVGRKYLSMVTARMELLWGLNSTAELSKLMKTEILKDKNSKVLIFSERTSQAEKISTYSIHSKNTKDRNQYLLESFDLGRIRELASCNSLTLGLNLKGANFAIQESYNSSSVSANQKLGRTDRLSPDDIAIAIYIVVKDTQSETWFYRSSKKMLLNAEFVIINNLTDFRQTLKQMKDEIEAEKANRA
jgi:superfamily II DNA or RNA helicase